MSSEYFSHLFTQIIGFHVFGKSIATSNNSYGIQDSLLVVYCKLIWWFDGGFLNFIKFICLFNI